MPAVKVYRGDTWKRTWILKDDAGNPVDLTGASSRLQVRNADGVMVAEASTANSRLTITPTQGKIDMIMPASAMALTPAAYRFDIEVTTAGGEVSTIEQATLVILEDIAHD